MSLSSTLNFIVRHPINRDRPIRAVVRFFQWQIISRLRSDVEFSWIDGSKLIVRRGMTGATGNIYCGLHEYVDMSFVLHMLRPGDIFLDIGANIGSYTILASSVCGAQCISVEPDPTTASHLARNIAANNVQALCNVFQTAVGAEDGTVSFTVGKDTVNQVAAEACAMTQVVPLTRLDTLIEAQVPTVMKMDIEGYECVALAGAGNLLNSPHLKAIIIEDTDQEIVSALGAHGFKRYFYDPALRKISDKEIASNNGIFVKDESWVALRAKTSASRSFYNKHI